jgi:biopolymer transport protein ExbD
MRQRGIDLLACGAAVLVLSACSIDVNAEKLVRREDRRFPVTGTPEVALKTFDGAIAIRSWEKPEVLVTIERQAGSEEALTSIQVTADQQGNQITVEVLRPGGSDGVHLGVHVGRSASLIVTVPRQANIRAGSGDGAISAEAVEGRLQLDTGDGAVSARRTAGELTVHTGDGGVTLQELMEVMDRLKDGGVERVGIVTQQGTQ